MHVGPAGVRPASIVEIDIRTEAPDEQANRRRCHIAGIGNRDVLLEQTGLRIEHVSSLQNPKLDAYEKVSNGHIYRRDSGICNAIARAISEAVRAEVIADRGISEAAIGVQGHTAVRCGTNQDCGERVAI